MSKNRIVAKLPRKGKMPYDIEICDDGNPVERTDDLNSGLDELEIKDTYYEADGRTTLDEVANLAESAADLSENYFKYSRVCIYN